MDMTELHPRIPLSSISPVLNTKRITRDVYLKARHDWMDWQKKTGQPPSTISLTEMEKETLNFIDYKLSQDEIDASREWLDPTEPEFLTAVNEVVADGYRITLTEDTKNRCIVVTLIGRAKDNINHDRAMATRHSDVTTALKMALYKHLVVYNAGTWGDTTAESMYG